MQLSKSVRSVASSVLSLLLALPLVGGSLAISPVLAAAAPTQTVIINEINWAGSVGNSDDQWIELQNRTATAIDFSSAPHGIYDGANKLVDLTSGTINPGGTFVISRLDPLDPTAHSTLTTLGGMKSDVVAPTLVISRTNLQLTIKDAVGTIVDLAGDGAMPLAGHDATGVEMAVASMARTATLGDGTLAVSWVTSHTVGKGIIEKVVQYGTPGTENLELAIASDLEAVSLPAQDVPTVKGKVVPQAGQVMGTFATVWFTDLKTKSVWEKSEPILSDGTFAVMSPVTLVPGDYRFTVEIEDAVTMRNRSAIIEVPIAGSPQNVYVVGPITPVMSAPVLDPYPAYVTTPTVTISGTVTAGTAVVISINKGYYTTLPITVGETAFSQVVSLNQNQVNAIEIRAKASNGSTSQPAVATVTHDAIVPQALVAAKVIVRSNGMGSADTIEGMPGSAEPHAVVRFYSDSALTKLITTTVVGSNGEFAQVSIGDNLYTTVYIVVTDSAGNISPLLQLENPIPFSEQPIVIALSVSDISQNQATVTWEPVLGAAKYRVKFKVVGGSYSSPVELCAIGSCANGTIITNLLQSTNYVAAVAAVNAVGNESVYTEIAFKTLDPVVVTAVSKPTYTGVGGAIDETPVRVATTTKTTPKPKPTATPSSTPSPSASPAEDGDVKSESTSSRNWTPWIILAVLIALAIIATLGYFYWFGGEEDDIVSTTERKSSTNGQTGVKSDEVTTKVTRKSNNQKRW